METIELSNVGPIEKLSIPLPVDGGVVVLLGRNGLGKSQAIAGVQSLADPSVRKQLRNRDGSKAGTIEGHGVRVRLGRVNTSSGELSVSSLDSVLDPSLLVDPGLKSADAADAKRLQVVARLAGITVEREEWMQLFDNSEEFTSLVDASDLEGSDPVEIADRLRRKLHDKARTIEKEIEAIQARADVAGADLPKGLPDSISLTPFHTDVSASESQLRSLKDAKEAAEKAKVVHAEQVAKLQSMKFADVADLTTKAFLANKAAEDNRRLAAEVVAMTERLRARIAEIEKEIAANESQVEMLNERSTSLTGEAAGYEREIEQSKAQQETARQLRESIDAGLPATPTDEAIRLAEEALATARTEVERATAVREAINRRDKWKELVSHISSRRMAAERIREIARSTDSAIEAAMSRFGLEEIKISDGRLCVQTDRGIEPFSDLSHGERWRIAFDLIARSLEEGGLVGVNQEAWESLDPDNRRYVAALAKARKVVVVTAEASDGVLRAVQFNEAKDGSDAVVA